MATHIEYAKPMIFKSNDLQAHGRKGSFESGFGSTISDAVLASCAAYPFFNKVKKEFRCEKLLIYFVLYFSFIRSDYPLENIGFI